jgi:hypothetical protein
MAEGGKALLFQLLLCGLTLGAAACSEDPERPPEYVASPPEDLRSCPDLRARGVLSGTEFTVDGKRANCAVEGLACFLEQTPEISERCGTALGEASCDGRRWRFRCDASDSGAPDSP